MEAEKDKMAEEMKRNIIQMGMKWDALFEAYQKTEEELKRKTGKKDAVKAGQIRLDFWTKMTADPKMN